MGDADGEGAKMTHKIKEESNILKEIRIEGLVELLLDTIPFPMNIIAMPYNLVKYGNLLKNTSNLQELQAWHVDRMMRSRTFSLLSPSYEKVSKHLKIRYEIL